jgi:hypothetical protein
MDDEDYVIEFFRNLDFETCDLHQQDLDQNEVMNQCSHTHTYTNGNVCIAPNIPRT